MQSHSSPRSEGVETNDVPEIPMFPPPAAQCPDEEVPNARRRQDVVAAAHPSPPLDDLACHTVCSSMIAMPDRPWFHMHLLDLSCLVQAFDSGPGMVCSQALCARR